MIDDFATAGWSGHLTWFSSHEELLKPTRLWVDSGHKYVWHVRYSPGGNYVAAVGTDGTLNVYKSKSGEVAYRVTGPVKGTERRPKFVPFHSLDWSPDGLVIAVGAADNNIYVFRAHDGAPYDRLVGHAETITDLAFSPDGRTLASTAGGPKLSMQYHEAVEGPDNYVRLWARP